ncbi:hypothetical protein nbrc107696_39270 [Gordonia spumicola]|uniref:Lipoprotein n=1 Tax=Gordonia spumicola TaxID=589161 RepID=A0A7I9VE94_9ACTN|nr:hypothetical protein [Gordonia spumicola]GEE03481.1 hypothetical protein nbrc107696_39270 [Gordonia spumicola]
MRLRNRAVVATLAVMTTVIAGCGGDPATSGPQSVSATSTSAVSTVTVTSTLSPTSTTEVTTDEPTVAPSPAPSDSAVSAGDQCYGYQTGSFAYDASGTQLVCTNYTWQVNVGQHAGTDWGDGQREWAECIQTHTEAECRRQGDH